MTQPAESDPASRADISSAPKSGDVASLADFVRYAYSREGQRVAYSPATAKRVAAKLELDDRAKRDLERLAGDDVLFRVPWQMLAAVTRARADQPVKSCLRRVVGEALRHHALVRPGGARSSDAEPDPKASLSSSAAGAPDLPDYDATAEPTGARPRTQISDIREAQEAAHVFGDASGSMVTDPAESSPSSQDARTVLERLSALVEADQDPQVGPPNEEVEECLDAVTNLSDSILQAGLRQREVELAARECLEFRANLINSTVLALASREKWTTARVADLLYRYVWKPARVVAAVDDATVQLTDRREGDVLALVVEVWEGVLGAANAQVAELEGQVRRAQNEVESLRRELTDAEAKMDSLTTDVARLTDTQRQLELEVAERDRQLRDGRAHASYDYETLRSRAVKRAKRELELLGEGLHALRRPEPKLHVTEDRLERALASLEDELARLRQGDAH